MTLEGWSVTLERFGFGVRPDTGGTAHLMCSDDGKCVRTACGSPRCVSGQLHALPPAYARHTCRTCLRIAKARQS